MRVLQDIQHFQAPGIQKDFPDTSKASSNLAGTANRGRGVTVQSVLIQASQSKPSVLKPHYKALIQDELTLYSSENKKLSVKQASPSFTSGCVVSGWLISQQKGCKTPSCRRQPPNGHSSGKVIHCSHITWISCLKGGVGEGGHRSAVTVGPHTVTLMEASIQ